MTVVGLLKVLVKLPQELELFARRFPGKDRQQCGVLAGHKAQPAPVLHLGRTRARAKCLPGCRAIGGQHRDQERRIEFKAPQRADRHARLVLKNGIAARARDVPPEKFVSEAQRVSADIIGISALLSTTQPSCKDVVMKLEELGLREDFKVILGGSGVDFELAVNEFGVDAAVNDGAEGVSIIESWVEEKRKNR